MSKNLRNSPLRIKQAILALVCMALTLQTIQTRDNSLFKKPKKIDFNGLKKKLQNAGKRADFSKFKERLDKAGKKLRKALDKAKKGTRKDLKHLEKKAERRIEKEAQERFRKKIEKKLKKVKSLDDLKGILDDAKTFYDKNHKKLGIDPEKDLKKLSKQLKFGKSADGLKSFHKLFPGNNLLLNSDLVDLLTPLKNPETRLKFIEGFASSNTFIKNSKSCTKMANELAGLLPEMAELSSINLRRATKKAKEAQKHKIEDIDPKNLFSDLDRKTGFSEGLKAFDLAVKIDRVTSEVLDDHHFSVDCLDGKSQNFKLAVLKLLFLPDMDTQGNERLREVNKSKMDRIALKVSSMGLNIAANRAREAGEDLGEVLRSSLRLDVGISEKILKKVDSKICLKSYLNVLETLRALDDDERQDEWRELLEEARNKCLGSA